MKQVYNLSYFTDLFIILLDVSFVGPWSDSQSNTNNNCTCEERKSIPPCVLLDSNSASIHITAGFLFFFFA